METSAVLDPAWYFIQLVGSFASESSYSMSCGEGKLLFMS